LQQHSHPNPGLALHCLIHQNINAKIISPQLDRAAFVWLEIEHGGAGLAEHEIAYVNDRQSW
jgi:hypothetical protein